MPESFQRSVQPSAAAPVRDNPRSHPLDIRRPLGAPSGGEGVPSPPAARMRTIISPPERWPGLGLGELWTLRAIAVVLARRALMVRYRETLVGVAWVLIQPVALMIVFSVFFGLVMKRSGGEIPFAVYVFTGLVIWLTVTRITGQGVPSIRSNAGLLSKIYFPRAYLPISISISSLVDFAFGMIALLFLLAFFQLTPTIWVITLPILTLMALATALGVTFWLSALNAEYRDVDQMMPFLTQMWFFATPIIYETSLFPAQFQWVFWINPIATVVNGFRWALTGAMAPPPIQAWLIGGFVATALLVTGYIFFRIREPYMTDVSA
jgi:lipopolysaccharide transport system permease protein